MNTDMRKKAKRLFKSTFSTALAAIMILMSVPIVSQAETEKYSKAVETNTPQTAGISSQTAGIALQEAAKSRLAAAKETSKDSEMKATLTVSTQKQLTQALADRSIKSITIKTSKAMRLTIPNRDYKAKVLLVNAPKAVVTNNGTFKMLTISDANIITENAVGNVYTVNDNKITIKITNRAKVKTITVNRENANCSIVVNGDLDQIILTDKTKMALKGSCSKNISLQISGAAKGTVIASSVPLSVNAKADASILLDEGAELSTVAFSKEDLNLVIENSTTKEVQITSPKGVETLIAGKTKRTQSDTTPKQTNIEPTKVPKPTKTPKPTKSPEPTKIPKPTIVPDNSEASAKPSTDNTNYTPIYTVSFQTGGGNTIDSVQVGSGNSITNLPSPQKSNSIFLGWYTDQGLMYKFNEGTSIFSDLTLYAKYSEIETEQGNLNDTFTLSDQVPQLSFNLISKDASMTADSVKNALVLDVADGSEAVVLSVLGDNGSYTVTAQNGFTEGASYTLTLNSTKLSFKDKESTICKCSFTIAKAEAYHFELKDSIIYIHSNEITDIFKNNTKVDSLSVSVVNMTENGGDDASVTGTFHYKGSLPLKAGNVLCIYSGDKPEAPKVSGDDTKFMDDDIAYIKVTSSTGSIGSQLIGYSNAEPKEVVFMPDILPIIVGEGSKLTDYIAATTDTPGSFKVGVDDLDFSANSNMGLSKETTIDKGDYLALYSGNTNDAGGTATVNYAEVTGVLVDNGTETITFTATTAEKMQENTAYYSKNNISGDTLLKGVDVASIEKNINNQMKQSGFDKKAAIYLTSLALKTDGFKKAAKDELKLESFSVKMADSSDKDLNQIKLMSMSSNSKVEIFNLKAYADINSNVQKLPGQGVRCEATVSFDVNIKNEQGKAIVISISATFIQELMLSYNASGDTIWSWVDCWFFKIPYISDYRMGVDIDVYNYTSINLSAVITSQNITITNQIKKIITSLNSQEITSGVQNLYNTYTDLVNNKVDNWVDLIKQNIFGRDVSLLGIIKFSISVDFVVNANAKVAIGCNYEHQSGTRYCFWAYASGNWGRNNIKLMDDKYDFQFYVVGTLGIRAGIRLTLAVNIFNKFDKSLYTETGAYFRLYGLFFYQLKAINNVQTSSSSGALYIDSGIYQAVYFNTDCLYLNEQTLWYAGNRNYIYNFAYDQPKDPIKIKYINSYTLSDDTFNMTNLELKEGNASTITYQPDKYSITFSDKNFTLSGNKVMVNVPSGVHKLESTMTVTWKESPLALSSLPITRTFRFTWDDLNDNGYTISFDSMGGSTVNSITALYDAVVSKPTDPTRIGYTFGGWFTNTDYTSPYTFHTMPAQNTNLYAKWIPRTDTKYRVEHYIQRLGSNPSLPSSYTLNETEILYGTTDMEVTAGTKTYEGFSNYMLPVSTDTAFGSLTGEAKSQTIAGSIKGDGSLALKQYYTRNSYSLVFKPENGSNDILSTLQYGSIITAPIPVKTGYSFIGWDKTVASTMPADNLTYSAQWMVNNYSIEFNTQGGTSIDKITQPYGTVVNEPITTRPGYVFWGWFRDPYYISRYSFSNMGADNITLYAAWAIDNHVPYKVEFWYQNASGDGYTLGHSFNYQGPAFNYETIDPNLGYDSDFNYTSTGSVTSGYIQPDGSLTLKLYYNRRTYTMYFETNGGNSMAPAERRIGSEEPLETPIRQGYIFAGWYDDPNLYLEYHGDWWRVKKVYAKWKPATDTPYKVEHYLQNISGEGYSLYETENLTGTSDSTTLVKEKTYSGFDYNSNASGAVNSGVITVDGSLILKLYYDLKTNTLSFNSNGGSDVGSITQKFKSAVTAPQDPTRVGYSFGGWYSDGALTNAYSLNFMPAESTTLYAKWIPNTDTPYKVEHYIENPYEQGWMLRETEKLTGTSGDTVTAVPMENYLAVAHVISGETVSSGNIAGDGSLVLKLYYENNSYTISFNSNGGSSVASITQKWSNHQVNVPQPQNPTKPGFYFDGWYTDEALQNKYSFLVMPSNDFTLYAKWIMDTNLWVGNVQVTPDNMNNIVGDGITGTVTFDPELNMLTLNNAMITSEYSTDSSRYAIYDKRNAPLTINLIGNNSISMPLHPYMSDVTYQYGIGKISNNLIIKGDSTTSLIAMAGRCSKYSAGIYLEDSDMTIMGGATVSAKGGAVVDRPGYSAGIIQYHRKIVYNSNDTSSIYVTDNSVLIMCGGSHADGLIIYSCGYMNRNNACGKIVISNGGQIIAYGSAWAMDGELIGASQVWTGKNPDGSDAALYTGGLGMDWTKASVQYFTATTN